MKAISEDIRRELIEFVLERTPVYHFNACTKSFSVQKIYSRYKKELMAAYPDLIGNNLHYSIVMCEVFRPYACDEIACIDLDFKIRQVHKAYKVFHKLHPRKAELAKEYNELVEKFNGLLKPQNELIKLYKKIQRRKKVESIS